MTRFEVILRPVTIDDYDDIYELWNCEKQTKRALNPIDDSREGIERYLKRNPLTCFLAWGLDEEKYKDNDPANSFWHNQGYTIRTNINYRNKSLNEDVPQGE